jgi:LuxR family maltose regulon positive regulatory protein
MAAAVLITKLYIPPVRPQVVARPRLVERLNNGRHGKMTLIAAPAGFGKTTVLSEWIAAYAQPVAWFSLDEGDSDPSRFLLYVVAALQTIVPSLGVGSASALQSPQPPSPEAVMAALINEIAALPHNIVLVLDDYHTIDAPAVDSALTFLLDHLPPQLHLVISTREDPQLPLARMRARGQLNELRAADLRFTPAEAAEFLNPVMGLQLSAADIAALEERTEGWIAGLQLAAISMQGLEDVEEFVQSFTGSHRFVMDYLVDEVLLQQPESIQRFLLQTSILNQLCGSLCDAVMGDGSISGQATLDHIDRANLFLAPLDNERRWYRYHHLFAELLRQRRHQGAFVSHGSEQIDEAVLHLRASEWYESQGMELAAFRHAIAAHDIERAERLIAGNGVPLYVRGGQVPVLEWLESLPAHEMDARPSLLVRFAGVLSVIGKLTRLEPILQRAEAAIERSAPDDQTNVLRERIAGLRTLVGVIAADPQHVDALIAQSRRGPEALHPDHAPTRTAGTWILGLAHQRQGNRAEARRVHTDVIAASEANGNIHLNILATSCLGMIQETDNQLREAAGTYRRALALVGEPPGPIACEAHVGLARIWYEWNDLETARYHGKLSVELARQLELASFVSSEVFIARLQIATGDVSGAILSLAQTEQTVRERDYHFRMPDVVAAQIEALLHQGNLAQASQLAQTNDLPLSAARVALAQGDSGTALSLLDPLRQQLEDKGWMDERLRAMVLQALAYQAQDDIDTAIRILEDVLVLTEPSGCIRLFIDEGEPMERLLITAAAGGIRPDYTARLLEAFAVPVPIAKSTPLPQPMPKAAHVLIDPLSPRELEVLKLIARGLSNEEIAQRLFLALSTVKGHNRVIFGKLDVQRRTEAVARARELALI